MAEDSEIDGYLSGLVEEHKNLEDRIAEERRRPMPDSVLLSDLKRQKLRIKDEIARLSSSQGAKKA